MTVVNTNRHCLTYLYSMGYLVKVTDDSYYIYEFCRKRRDGFFAKTSAQRLSTYGAQESGRAERLFQMKQRDRYRRSGDSDYLNNNVRYYDKEYSYYRTRVGKRDRNVFMLECENRLAV